MVSSFQKAPTLYVGSGQPSASHVPRTKRVLVYFKLHHYRGGGDQWLAAYRSPNRVDIWQAAAAPNSMLFIFVGVGIVLPLSIGYTVFAYRVFWGKATALEY
jgi:hypothetical protein